MDDLETRKWALDPWRGCLAHYLDEGVGAEKHRDVLKDMDLKGEHTCEENVIWTSHTIRRFIKVVRRETASSC